MLDLILNSQSVGAALDAVLASQRKGDRTQVLAAEDAVRAKPREAIRFDANGFATIHVAERSYAAGRFETVSLRELKQRVAALGAPASSPFKLSVIHGAGVLSDIGTLQATSDDDTVFQVASQLNCLEATGPEITAVANYFSDPTQGPRASISAFPGTLVRHYAAPRGKQERFVQTDYEQVNLLHNVCPPSVALAKFGYLTSRDIFDRHAFAAALEHNFEAIEVGVHEGIDVVLGYNWDGLIDPTKRPRIAQVFSSTFAGGSYSERGNLEGTLPAVCRQLLRATYAGALLAAASLKKHKVVLTLIGGGVFGNPHSIIVDAILWAVREVEALSPTPMHVIINAWGGFECDTTELRAQVQGRKGLWCEAHAVE